MSKIATLVFLILPALVSAKTVRETHPRKTRPPLFPPNITPQELCQAISQKAKTHRLPKKEQRKLPGLCKAIVEAGKRWGLPPTIIAGIVWTESSFKSRPPSGKVCRMVYQFYEKPGPQPPGYPRLVKKCKRYGHLEIGYMQLIHWHKMPKRVYQLITGKKPNGSQYIRDLRKTRINIMVGAYEAVTECKRCKRAHRHHIYRLPRKLRKFFRKNPRLFKWFCVAHYNWGGTHSPIRRWSKWWNQWAYPLKVLRRTKTLAKWITQNRHRLAIIKRNHQARVKHGTILSDRTHKNSQGQKQAPNKSPDNQSRRKDREVQGVGG